MATADIEARVKRAAEILELGPFLDRKPRELSGGQRQRVAMGRAIVREPAVFLFDEPLSNLDAKLRVQMRVELQALHRRLGTTSLYVTHDQVEAMTLAHRMIVMNTGRAEQIGAPIDVYARPATTFVAGFIGSPPMNLIPSKLDGRDVLLGVRPEHLEPCGESEANFIAEVDLVEPLGADTLAHGKVDGERIIARLHAALNTVEGRMPLRFRPENRHYFDAATGARLDACAPETPENRVDFARAGSPALDSSQRSAGKPAYKPAPTGFRAQRRQAGAQVSARSAGKPAPTFFRA